MFLHKYLTKYKLLFYSFDEMPENYIQKIRVAIMDFIHTDVDNNLFSKNMKVLQSGNEFILIFWDTEKFCAYLISEINISKLSFPYLDYSDKVFSVDYTNIDGNILTVHFTYSSDYLSWQDFDDMPLPIAQTYVFDITKLSENNTVVGVVQ